MHRLAERDIASPVAQPESGMVTRRSALVSPTGSASACPSSRSRASWSWRQRRSPRPLSPLRRPSPPFHLSPRRRSGAIAPADTDHPGPRRNRAFSAYPNDRRVLKDGGLAPGTYATSIGDACFAISGLAVAGRYALPNPSPAIYVYTIVPGAGIAFLAGTTAPAYGQAGGGGEVCFTAGTPKGTAFKPLRDTGSVEGQGVDLPRGPVERAPGQALRSLAACSTKRAIAFASRSASLAIVTWRISLPVPASSPEGSSRLAPSQICTLT